MKIVKLYGNIENLGGIVAFQKSLDDLNARSGNVYFHFKTGRVATSNLQSVSLFRYMGLVLSFVYFPLYLLYLRPDVVEINSSLNSNSLKRDYWYARMASLVIPKARRVLFNHGWNDAVKARLIKKNKPWLLRYFSQFDRIIVLAVRFRQELRSLGVVTPVDVLTTAIDLKEFTNFPARRNTQRKHVLFLSRLEKEKGIKELLDAIPALISRHPHLEICIAGSGSYEETARAHRSVLVHRKNIRFCGYVSGKEKLDLLASADIFVFPSYSEGCPISVLEALAAGLPVVYTPVGALPDLMENGSNGIQVEPGSSTDIQKAILHLLDNPQLMDEMGANNRELCKRFDLGVIHKKLERIYEDND